MNLAYNLTNSTQVVLELPIGGKVIRLHPGGTLQYSRAGRLRPGMKQFTKELIRLIRTKALTVQRVRINLNARWQVNWL